MKTYPISILALLFALMACGKPEKSDASKAEANDQIDQATMADKEPMELPTVEAIGLTQGEIQAIYMNYKQMTGFLIESDGRLTQAAAEYMDEDMRGMSGEMAEIIKEAVKKIRSTQDIEVQREQYKIISETLYPMVKVVNPGMKLYWQNCPMAFNDQGANWLSETEEIRNPYFGDEMMSCGTTVDVLE